MLNNIPICPNASIVTVEKVFTEDAFLWRPLSAEIATMGKALHEKIAWPVQSIELVNSSDSDEGTQQTSSPLSLSNSSGSTGSKAVKKKCIVLDCNGSGQQVAEGRVCSTNPEDKVHFVPLCPNASKVWVEVAKVENAQVWRPNSEVEIIADEVGTTVAWPNDKSVFV